MERFYYENRLASQNQTAKNDIVWAADYTELDLKHRWKPNAFD